MLCDKDLCLGGNDCIDIKCDIVFVIPLATNNNYINSGNFVNSAMLPPSLMVFIPFLYCGIFFEFHYRGHLLRSIPFLMSGHLNFNFFQSLGTPFFNTNLN